MNASPPPVKGAARSDQLRARKVKETAARRSKYHNRRDDYIISGHRIFGGKEGA